jgi:hypothetical protein
MADQQETVTVSANADRSLQAFSAQDFLKSSQFLFSIPELPFNVGQLTGKNPRGFSMFCESVEFPGKNVQATDYKIPGYDRVRVPYSREYPEVTMTFIHNVEIPVYDIFSYWVDWIIQDFTSIETRYHNEITSDLTLIQYSEFAETPYGKFRGLSSILNTVDKINRYIFDSNKLFKVTDIGQQFVNNINNVSGLDVTKQKYYEVKFIGAYPLSFASMPATWADEGYHRLSVTFTYQSYVINEKAKNDFYKDRAEKLDTLTQVSVTGKKVITAFDSVVSSKTYPGGGSGPR